MKEVKVTIKIKKIKINKITRTIKTIIMQDWTICGFYYMVLCWHKFALTAKLSLT